MAHGINAAVQSQQPASANPLFDAAGTEAEDHQLPPAHNAPLPSRDPLQPG
jgi:hypothetical protein